MREKFIEKKEKDLRLEPNLKEYEKEYKDFKWDKVAGEFEGLPEGGFNIAHEAIDRHANGPLAEKKAFVWLGQNGQKREFTFLQMKKETAKSVEDVEEAIAKFSL